MSFNIERLTDGTEVIARKGYRIGANSEARRIAESPCLWCGKPIGTGNAFIRLMPIVGNHTVRYYHSNCIPRRTP